MTTHDLKIWPEYFAPVADGRKTFEMRKNDRNYKVGDILKLNKWNPVSQEYTGNYERMKVTYILTGALTDECMVIMSIIPYHGRKCSTCGDYLSDNGVCSSYDQSTPFILPVGGLDENDPTMLKALDCWRGM